MRVIKNFNIKGIIRVIRLMGRRKYLFLGIISGFALVEIGSTILYAIGIKGIFTAISDIDIKLFWESLVFIIVKGAMWWMYAPISSYISNTISKSTMCDVKINLCNHLFHLPMEYYDKKAKGDTLSALSNDVNGLQRIFDSSLFQVLKSITGGLSGIVIMMFLDWRLAIIVFSLGTASVVFSSHFSKKLATIGGEIQKSLAESSTDLYELVKAAKTIRIFRLFAKTTETYEKSTKVEADIKLESGRVLAKMKAINLGISSLSYILILFIGAIFVYYKFSDWGTVIAITSIKYTADQLFKESGEFLAAMQKNLAAANRLFEIFDISKEKCERVNLYIEKGNKFAVSLKNVFFSYDGITPVIDDLSLFFKKNKLNVLVGKSGVGKSTVIKLLLGLYSPQKGSIVFDGGEEATLLNIRRKTAYVPQEVILLGESIYENIRWGSEKANKKAIIAVAKLAGVYKFIVSLEYGFDTILFDDGANLSGGQKQRILIARALLKDSPILLLDEITSALDSKIEEEIMKTIKQISKTKTTIVITHKEEVMRWGDNVFYI